MSPLPARVVLDNDVISNLHKADSLGRILRLWPGFFVITQQVYDEARNWKEESYWLIPVLDSLEAKGYLGRVHMTREELGTFAALRATRGVGESASIAVAYHRGFIVATDDLRARKSCASLTPPVPVIGTEDLLRFAIRDSYISEPDLARDGDQRPRRGL